LAFALERAGFTALVAPLGQEQLRPDGLIAIVSGLPGGHRDLRRLRQLDGYQHLPVIVVTKPFSPSELVARVHADVAGERRVTQSDSRADALTQPAASAQLWEAAAPGAYHSAPQTARALTSWVRTPAPRAQCSCWERLMGMLRGEHPRTCPD
jgi:DNA-binding response OmpR family regulator